MKLIRELISLIFPADYSLLFHMNKWTIRAVEYRINRSIVEDKFAYNNESWFDQFEYRHR